MTSLYDATTRIAIATLFLLFGVSASIAQADPGKFEVTVNDPKLPTVAIITTGGTIAEKTDPETGGAIPAVSGKDLIAAVPGLEEIANVGILAFSDIDSSQMTPELWARLSKTVDEILAREDVVGAVITHGTDTIAPGACFLDVTFQSDKPVAFTGAMDDASSTEVDGPVNILNAVIQVLSSEANDWGVTVTFNRFVNSARYVRKANTTNLQAFNSGEQGYMGYIFNSAVTRYNNRDRHTRLQLPDTLPEDLPDVPLLSM